MSDVSEVSLKTVCCTCLNTNRKLQKLCRISEGVNILYLLLSHDPDSYKEIFCKDSTSLHICWECAAVMKKVRLFQEQATKVMKKLNDFCNTSGKLIKPLSSLSTHNIGTNQTIVPAPTEHFIDCGHDIKTDLDPDDIPLSKLYHYNYYKESVEIQPETVTKSKIHEKQAYVTTIKLINQKNSKELEYISELDQNDIPESLNSPISDCKKAHSPEGNYKTMTKSMNLKILEKIHDNVSESDESVLIETVNSPTMDCIEAYRSIKAIKEPHKTIIKPSDNNKETTNDEITKKGHKKKLHNFNENNKKRKKETERKNELTFKYPCPECDLCFENKNTRWKHVQKLHREGYQCSVCEKRFSLKSNLQRHEKLHSSPPPRSQCSVCHKYIRVDLMSAHSRTHTERQRHACRSCDKSFVCGDTYRSHLKYSKPHAGTDVLARYKCSKCEKRYRSQAELRDHINYQHEGQTIHKCPVCGKGLATKRCVRRHVRRAHEGIRENAKDKICQHCGKAFRDKKSVVEHEYIHTGSRPLSCSLCAQTFRQHASLHTHRKRVHKLNVTRRTLVLL